MAIVIDPYQGNEIGGTEVATDPRVVGVIHRATIGSRKDTKYAERKAEATTRGYRWGSYHLGSLGIHLRKQIFTWTPLSPLVTK